MISETGEQLGVMSIYNAIKRAQDAELDLVEVSPNTNPPVCKITDYGQFQYSISKRQKSNKPKKVDTKCLRISLKIGKHDLDVKRKQIEKFLKQGDRARVEMPLRGREREHKDLGIKIIQDMLNELTLGYKIEQEIKFQEGKISVIINSK